MGDAAIVVAEFASEQWGVITAAQARTQGVTPVQMKRLADRGALERVHHGIYYMTRLPYDPLQDLRVAWIALDPHASAWERLNQPFPGGVVSHRTAAHMHQLGDIDADLTEFTCQHRIRLTLPDIRIHTGTVETADWTTVNGLPVTTARRTIEDLAAARIDGGHLATIVRDALSRELVSDTEVEKTLAAHAFEYGYTLGDGRAFLITLIEQAGVSTNTLALASGRPPTGPTDQRVSGRRRHERNRCRANGCHERTMRAFIEQSITAPQADMLREITQNLRNPALDAMSESLAQVMAPITQQATANILLGLGQTATTSQSEANPSDGDTALPQAESAADDNA